MKKMMTLAAFGVVGVGLLGTTVLQARGAATGCRRLARPPPAPNPATGGAWPPKVGW